MRVFAAIDLPAPIRRRLSALAVGIPGARWVPEESLHLTLRFIGEVDGVRLDDAMDALASVDAEPFDLRLEGTGHFETKRKPHTLWAGVASSAPLQRLHASVDMALQRVGFAPEGRKYQPHVTLARLKDTPPARLKEVLVTHGGLRTEDFRVDGFTLYSSFLARTGAQYRAEAAFPFGGRAPGEGGGERSDDEAADDGWDPWNTAER